MSVSSDAIAPGFLPDEENLLASGQFSDFEELSSSGFNRIVKAKRFDRWWTLKGLKPELCDSGVHRALLRKEFETLIPLQHDGIARAFSFENVAGMGWCIVMEWVDGMTLKEWLFTPHSRKERLHVACRLLDVLDYVHAQGTVHRDLKPSNIMLTHGGTRVKLIDFGLSDSDASAIFKQPAGTPGYIAPEQASSHATDVRHDIYSLGCVLSDLQLGWTHAAIVRRCKAAAERRYANIAEVQRAIRRVWEVKRAGVFTLSLLFLAGILTFSFCGRPQDARIHAVADSLQRNVAEHRRHTDSSGQVVAALGMSLDTTAQSVAARFDRERYIVGIIEEEKSRMNEMATYNLDTITTEAQCHAVLVRLAARLDDFVRTFQSRHTNLSEWEAQGVYDALSHHQIFCLRPLQEKMFSLRRQEEARPIGQQQ